MKELNKKPHRCEEAHKIINDRRETRPFNEQKVEDGSWNFVHRCDAHIAVDIACNEGVALFAAWLLDNTEGKTITEELLMKWGSQCIRENDNVAKFLGL